MKERAAYWVPLVVALAVLVVGGVKFLGDSDVLDPEAKTTVTTDAVPEVPGAKKTTTEVVKQRGTQTKTTTTTEQQAPTPAQPAKTETTIEKGERTFLERVLGDGGLVALQLGALLLAAFLAAALLQRILLGQYAITIGSLELPAVATAEVTADALEALDAKIDELDQQRRDGAANVREDLAILYRRLDLIEKQLEP